MTELSDEQCRQLSDLLTRVHLGDSPHRVIVEATGTDLDRVVTTVLSVTVPSELQVDERSIFTKRQQLILGALAAGWRAPDLARSLGVGVSTIHTQVLRAKRITGYDGPVAPWLEQLVADGVIRPAWRSSA